jgi:hypothetical protein
MSTAPKRQTHVHFAAFNCWHQADRSWRAVAQEFGVSENTVYLWMQAFGWHARADTRDREAAKLAERAAVARRARILESQAKAGELLLRRGVEHLAKTPIENTNDAIRAIKEGVALQRQAEGLPQFLAELLVMSDDELRTERERVFRRLAADSLGPPALGAGDGESDGDDREAAAVAGTDPLLSP